MNSCQSILLNVRISLALCFFCFTPPHLTADTLFGVVRNTVSGDQAGAQVLLTSVEPTTGQIAWIEDAHTDDSGRFTFTFQRPGHLYLRALDIMSCLITPRAAPTRGVPVDDYALSSPIALTIAPGTLIRVRFGGIVPGETLRGQWRQATARGNVAFLGEELLIEGLAEGRQRLLFTIHGFDELALCANLHMGVFLDTLLPLVRSARRCITVVDDAGEPISNVICDLLGQGSGRSPRGTEVRRSVGGSRGDPCCYTDDAGTLCLPVPDSTTFDVQLSHPLYRDTLMRIAGGVQLPRVTLRTSGSSVAGELVGCGYECQECRLVVEESPARQSEPTVPPRWFSVRPDVTGHFAFDAAPGATYDLALDCPDLVAPQLRVVAGDRRVVVPLAPATSIAGRIVDEASSPIPDFRVTVTSIGLLESLQHNGRPVPIHNDLGLYEIPARTPDVNVVCADAPDYLRGCDTIDLTRPTPLDGQIMLRRCSSLGLTLLSSDHTPCIRGKVIITGDGLRDLGAADSNGVVTFGCIPPGTYCLRVHGDSPPSSLCTLDVSGTVTASITLGGEPAIGGSVCWPDGIPASGVDVCAEQTVSRRTRRTCARVAEDGTFVVGPLLDDYAALHFLSSGTSHRRQRSSPLLMLDSVVAGTRDLVIELPDTRFWRIIGRSHLQRTTAPLSVRLRLVCPTGAVLPANVHASPNVITAALGDTLRALVGSTYRLSVRMPDEREVVQTVQISHGKGLLTTQVILDNPYSLVATVVDEDSVPVGAEWTVSASLTGHTLARASTDGLGRLTLGQLDAGVYLVTVLDPADQLRHAEYIRLPAPVRVLRLPVSGTLDGTVSGEPKSQLMRLPVHIAELDCPTHTVASALCDSAGRWGPVVLPPGDFVVTACRLAQWVHVESASHVTCRLRAPRSPGRPFSAPGNDMRQATTAFLFRFQTTVCFHQEAMPFSRDTDQSVQTAGQLLPRGRYQLFSRLAPGEFHTWLGSCAIPASPEYVLPNRHPEGALQVVVQSPSGSPLRGAVVSVWSTGATASLFCYPSKPAGRLATGANGIACFSGLPAGRYRVCLQHPSMAAQCQKVSIGSSTGAVVRFDAAPGTRLCVVATVDGRERADAYFLLTDSLSEPLIVSDGADTSFSPVALPSGRYRLTVGAPLHAVACTTVVVHQSPRVSFTIRMSLDKKGGWILCAAPEESLQRLVLRDSSHCQVHTVRAPLFGDLLFAEDSDPWLLIPDLPEGKYVAELAEGPTQPASVNVRPGAVSRIVIPATGEQAQRDGTGSVRSTPR